MFDRVRAARAKEGGFTLIELLIVIVILGILAAVVVFSVRGITDRGKTAACKADVATVQVAVEADYTQNGAPYETSVDALKNAGFLRTNPGTVAIAADGTATGTGTCAGLAP